MIDLSCCKIRCMAHRNEHVWDYTHSNDMKVWSKHGLSNYHNEVPVQTFRLLLAIQVMRIRGAFEEKNSQRTFLPTIFSMCTMYTLYKEWGSAQLIFRLWSLMQNSCIFLLKAHACRQRISQSVKLGTTNNNWSELA